MIHIPLGALAALVVWYYDPEIRKKVNEHVKPHIDKVEGKAVKICKSVRDRVVNRDTTDPQE